MNNRTLIIAEAGVNHNGDLNLAFKLIDVAADAGADYVKFQTFRADKLVSPRAEKALYQQKNSPGDDNSQYQMLKKLELDEKDHKELIAYASSKKIKFLSTAFDLESVDLLHALGISLFKIPSGEITNLPFIEKIAKLGKPVILSTGMSTMQEIQDALQVLQHHGLSKEMVTVLHCNTQYPTPMEDVNLNAMSTMARTLGVRIGYSDHTPGIEVPIAAVALGATVIEKHFTIDRNLPGPDHKASLEPDELKQMILSIRNIEKALGSHVKTPTPSEIANMKVARKSIHLLVSKRKDEVIATEDLVMLRPGDGISPMEYKKVAGRKAKSDLLAGHKIHWKDLE
jgi:N,N'-diacetyllegionaminate synthase